MTEQTSALESKENNNAAGNQTKQAKRRKPQNQMQQSHGKPPVQKAAPGTTKRIFGYVFQYKWRVALVVVCILVGAAAQAGSSLFLQSLIDTYILIDIVDAYVDAHGVPGIFWSAPSPWIESPRRHVRPPARPCRCYFDATNTAISPAITTPTLRAISQLTLSAWRSCRAVCGRSPFSYSHSPCSCLWWYAGRSPLRTWQWVIVTVEQGTLKKIRDDMFPPTSRPRRSELRHQRTWIS